MIDFTPLFEAIITLLAAVITMYVVPWLKERYTAEQLVRVRSIVEVAVFAAEKAYGAGHGYEKMQYVKRLLASYNVELDMEKLDALVDSYIKKMEQAEPWLLEQDSEEDPPEVV